MSFEPGQLVDVRYAESRSWYPGFVGINPDGCCYVVALDEPQPTRLEWTGISRPLANDSLVTQTLVHLQTEQLTPGQFIKDRGA